MLNRLMLMAALAAPAMAQDQRPLLIPAAAFSASAPRDAAAQAALLAKADAALALKPPSVLDKSMTPASGDKHDFLSFGPYWWPNPSKPDGLPYIRRDGERNPAIADGSDSAAFSRVCSSVETLGLAFWITRDERYAAKAAALVRVFFLDAKTRMNPNFQHAQAIPGVSAGRGIGLIEARWLIHLNEGLALLAPAKSWTATDRREMRDWLESFYTWLRTSANGRDEQAERNNHGSWYDAQTAHLALVLGRKEDAKAILQEGLKRRVAAHIEPDGSQPHELARTRSLDYAIFNLEALMLCAQLADHVGLDWWNFATVDGRSLHAALAFLAPFADPRKTWPKRDVYAADRGRLIPLLAQFLRHRDDASLRRIYDAFAVAGPVDSHERLFGDLQLPRR
ncbi:alginate lyase family protein [Paucibacter sp. JuS9]|uniref:alginate lyase family protein n=1 Tax=Paucibacter sp. JuS9 TaxID=3228748 RepID=UPI0037581FAD